MLADRVVVLAGGRVIAEGTPDTLGRRRRVDRLLPRSDGRSRRASRTVHARPSDLAPLLAPAAERGEELEGLTVTRPSLEDVYLELTEDRS